MNNPLSPHLEIYRWQITSVLSILHRITGVVSSLGAVILILFLFSIGVSEEFFVFINNILNGLSFSYLFYFSNCIRHLFWDSGYGLDLNTAKLTGWFTIIFTLLLTVIFWLLITGVI